MKFRLLEAVKISEPSSERVATTLNIYNRLVNYPREHPRWFIHTYSGVSCDIVEGLQKDHVTIRLHERSVDITKEEFRSKLETGLDEVIRLGLEYQNIEDARILKVKNQPKNVSKNKKLKMPKTLFRHRLNQYMIVMTESEIKVPVHYRKKDEVIYVPTVLEKGMNEHKGFKKFNVKEQVGENEYIIYIDAWH